MIPEHLLCGVHRNASCLNCSPIRSAAYASAGGLPSGVWSTPGATGHFQGPGYQTPKADLGIWQGGGGGGRAGEEVPNLNPKITAMSHGSYMLGPKNIAGDHETRCMASLNHPSLGPDNPKWCFRANHFLFFFPSPIVFSLGRYHGA